MNTKNTHGRGLLDRLLGRSDIQVNGDVYMRRWRILNTRWCGVRVHHILRSDSDRELHDHPFSFLSIILAGGYYEHRPRIRSTVTVIHADGRQEERTTTSSWYGSGSVVRRRAEDLHRLELLPGKTTWTLVFRGPVRRRWGFQTQAGWVDAKDFASTGLAGVMNDD